MPYQNDIYVGGDRVKNLYRGSSLICEVYAGATQVYDGRPKIVSGLVGAYEDGVTTLVWMNNSTIADEIRIEYKVGSTWTLIEKVAKTETEYEHNWEPAAGTYEYRVLPENQCGYVTDGVDVESVVVIAFALDPATVVFADSDLSGVTKQTTLTCANSWSRINVSYGTGPDAWFSTDPNSGGATTGTTITVTLNEDNPEETWAGTATYQDSVTEATRVLTIAVEVPE